MPGPRHEFLLKDLLHAVYWFDESLQNHLEAAGWPRTSRTKSMILINIADGVTRPIQIAANLGISRQAIHLALAELEQDGLVRLEPDPQDRRAKRLRFSDDPRGIRMRDHAVRALCEVEKQLEARLGAALYRQLCKALRTDWGPSALPGLPPAGRL
jgi:DNA-binding MarR family transcriptional regulator